MSDSSSQSIVWEVAYHQDGTTSVRLPNDDEGSTDTKAPSEEEGEQPGQVFDEADRIGFEALTAQWTNYAIGFLHFGPILLREQFKAFTSETDSDLTHAIERYGILLDEDDDGDTVIKRFSFDDRNGEAIANIAGRTLPNIFALRAMSQSSLGALLAEYEALMGALLRVTGKIEPRAFVNDSDTIPASLLSEYDSLDDLRAGFVDTKIDDLLHESSHLVLLREIEKRFKIKIVDGNGLIPEFVEICQRRHVITHNGGVVNRRYRRLCLEAGYPEAKISQIGAQLDVDAAYLRRATARVFQIGYFTLHLLWNKLVPDDFDESRWAVLGDSHEFLTYGFTKMCRRLTQFALSAKKMPSQSITMRLLVNEALSHKYEEREGEGRSERLKRVEQVLSKHDWSVIDSDIELALAVLRDDFDEVDRMLPITMSQEKPLGFYEFHTWALFKEMREMERFEKHFQSLIMGESDKSEQT